jgi:hypothetical protein
MSALSREAALKCSPRRKPWEKGATEKAPAGRKISSRTLFQPLLSSHCCHHALQFPPQRLQHLPNSFLVPPIPTPLPLFAHFDQPGLRQDPHVMRNRRLRKMNPFFNLSTTKARPRGQFVSWNLRLRTTFFQRLQNSAPGWVGNRVQRAVERCVRHAGLRISRESMAVNVRNRRRLELPAFH